MFSPIPRWPRGLKKRGHEVLLIAPAQFAETVQAEDVTSAPLPGVFLDLRERPETKKIIGGLGTGFGAGFKPIKHYRHLMRGLLDADLSSQLPSRSSSDLSCNS